MPPFRRAEIWADYQAAGGARLAAIPDLLAAGDVRRLDGSDELTLTLPIGSGAWPAVREQRVVRIGYADASFDEWRIAGIKETRGAGGLVGTVTCVPPLADLARALVGRAEADGSVAHDVEAVQLTPTQHLDTFLVPALADAGLSWIARGTVEPTVPVDLVYSWVTPLEALRQLAASAVAELRLRRNGTTQYLIDLVTAIGSTAPVVQVLARKNAQALERQRSGVEQATRVYPRGTDEDGQRATMARARWQVTAIAGLVITLADPAGGDGPVAYDGQLNFQYLRTIAGGLTQITASSASAQTVTVASAAGFAVNDLVEVRLDSAGTDLTFLGAPAATGTYGLRAGTIDRPDLPATVNLVSNPALATWSAGLPTGWTIVGAPTPTVTETTTAARWRTGGRSARVQTAGDGIGIQTALMTIAPSSTSPYFSGYASLWLVSGRVRVELVASDGITAWRLPDGTDGRAYTTQLNTWVDLGVAGIDLKALGTGATQLWLRVVQDGATATEFYLDSAQVTQSAGQRPFVDGAGPTRLWQAANEHLLKYADPQIRVDVRLLDLERLDRVRFSADALALGGTVRLKDAGLPLDVSTRVTEIRRNLLVAADSAVVLSNRPEDLTDALVRPARVARAPRSPVTDTALTVQAVFTLLAQSPGAINARLTARPTSASIKYVVQAASVAIPVIGAAAWSAYTSSFTVTQSATEDQVVAAYVELGGRFSQVETWTIPKLSVPSVLLTTSESPAGTVTASWTPLGDVVWVALYRKKNGAGNGWPTTDNNVTGPLDPAQFVRRLHVLADGGGWDATGNPIAGGTSYSETGFVNTDVVKFLAVALDKNGQPASRASASYTVAGVTPKLNTFSGAKTTDGTSCAAPAQITLSWTVNAGVSNATHDLKIYRALNGDPRELVQTIASPVTTLSYANPVQDFVGTAATYSWVYSYELVAGSTIVDSGTAAAVAFQVNGRCPV